LGRGSVTFECPQADCPGKLQNLATSKWSTWCGKSNEEILAH
jgi:hypothetical protein